MFLRLLKQNTILMLRSKEGLFWTVFYPILLSWLYFAAFSSAFNFSQNKINIGIEKNNPYYTEISFIPIFTVVDIEENNTDAALRNKQIDGFIQNDFSLRIMNDGINQTIIKSVLDQIKQTHKLGVFINPFDYGKSYIKSINEKNNSPLILFYSLLAMVSIYGMFGAMSIPFLMQANISKIGARISTTPLNRFASYMSGLIFYTLFNLAANILYIFFVTYILKISFITNLGTTLIILLFANIFGVAYGMFIGSLPIANENIKTLFCVFSSLFLSFLSGMMSPAVKLMLDKVVPAVNKINPIGILTDNLYNVNVLQEYNLITSFMIVFITITVLLLIAIFVNSRKVQYDSL